MRVYMMSAGRCLRGLPKSNCITQSLSSVCRIHSAGLQSATFVSTSRRQFTNTTCHLHTAQDNSAFSKIAPQNELTSQGKSELALEDELLAIQDAAIADLEAKLGKPLQQAIEEDQLAETLLAGTRYGNDSEEEYTLVEETESPLVPLRAAGVPPQDVVREARNIFGDYLPQDVLTKDEFAIYRRLYGDPLPEVDEEKERLIADAENVDVDQMPGHILYSAEGEELPYRLESAAEIESGIRGKDLQHVSGPNSRIEEIARAVQGDLVDEETYDYEQDEEEYESEDARSHPLTKIGKFATYPRTTFFSKETFVQPIEEVMSSFSNKQLREVCERTFGGPGLPDSPLTPKSGRSRQQVPIPLEAGQNTMGQMEANAFMTAVMPPVYASISAVLTETRKRLGASWLNKVLAKPGGPRILDAGSGGAGILAWRDVVTAHWETLHSSDKSPPPAPESKSVVLTGSDTLRHRAMKMLDNTTFIPRLPDYIQTRQTPTIDDDRPAQQRKQFDVIIASHSLFALKEEWARKLHVQNLWSLLSNDGGVLILVEKGIPRGFETIAAAREMLLERYITTPAGHDSPVSTKEQNINEPDNEIFHKTPGMIIAPCTNHKQCPLYRTPGISRGRKDICSFQQRYVRPPFLQRVLGAKDRNHDDVDFSYLAVMKGEDLRTRSFSTWEDIIDPLSTKSAKSATSAAEIHNSAVDQIQSGFEYTDPTWSDSPAPPPTHTLPRIINQPLKRQAHVTMDLCTPAGEIRRWTIPKSFSRQAYRDARKARWGDLWALGAKTNIPRNLKTGVSEKDIQASGGKMAGPLGKGRGRKERLEMQAERIIEAEEMTKAEEESEEAELMRMIEEDGLLDEADEDDDTIDMDTLLPKSKSAKHKQNHAKLNNINIFGKNGSSKHPSSKTPTTTSSSSSRPTTRSTFPESTNDNIMQPDTTSFTPIETRDYTPGRYGDDNAENLSAWSEEYNDKEVEDEAVARIAKTGRRPTTKNTYRLKKELRRLKREMSKEI